MALNQTCSSHKGNPLFQEIKKDGECAKKAVMKEGIRAEHTFQFISCGADDKIQVQMHFNIKRATQGDSKAYPS